MSLSLLVVEDERDIGLMLQDRLNFLGLQNKPTVNLTPSHLTEIPINGISSANLILFIRCSIDIF